MENNATYDLQPMVDQVKFYGSVILDEDVTEQKILEIGQIVLDKIGIKHNEVFLYEGKTDKSGRLNLPCNVEIIEAVGSKYAQHSYNSVFSPLAGRSRILDKAVYRVRDRSETYFKGDFINYNYMGDYMLLDEKWKDTDIVVMYLGRIVDELGRPLITDREAEAIVYYMMYLKEVTMRYKRIGDNGAAADVAFRDAVQAINRARVPIYINQNTIQDLKQTMQSRNQWKYNRNYRKHN